MLRLGSIIIISLFLLAVVEAQESELDSATGSLCDENNGGCSERCEVENSAVVCSCTSRCWMLNADGKTCVPRMVIDCEGNVMNATLAACSVEDVIGLRPYIVSNQIAPSNCHYILENGKYKFSFNVLDCNTTTTTINESDIKYSNVVRVVLDWSNHTDVITREGVYIDLNFACSFSTVHNVSKSYWVETRKGRTYKMEGLGDFTFEFNFNRDQTFSEIYENYPITYKFNDTMYFSISSTANIGNVQLFTKSCSATPQGDFSDSKLSYNFIQDGCLGSDSTLEMLDPANNLENRFSIKAFRFRSTLGDITPETRIKLKCTVQVCVIGEDTVCSRGCSEKNRNRRGLDVEESMAAGRSTKESQEHNVYMAGPFQVADPQKEDAPGELVQLTSNNSGKLMGVIVVLGVMVLVLAVGTILAMVILRRRKRGSMDLRVDAEESKGMVEVVES